MKRFILIVAGVLTILPGISQEFIIKGSRYSKYGIEEISINTSAKKAFTFSAGFVADNSYTFQPEGSGGLPPGGGAGFIFDMNFARYFGLQTQLILGKRTLEATPSNPVYPSYGEKEINGFTAELPIMLSGRMPLGDKSRVQFDMGYEFMSVDGRGYHGLVLGVAYTYKSLYAGLHSFIQPHDKVYDLGISLGMLFECRKKGNSSVR